MVRAESAATASTSSAPPPDTNSKFSRLPFRGTLMLRASFRLAPAGTREAPAIWSAGRRGGSASQWGQRYPWSRGVGQRCSAATSLEGVAEWQGLKEWRNLGVDKRRHWGDKGPEPQGLGWGWEHLRVPDSLAATGKLVLSTADPLDKIQLSHLAWRAFRGGEMHVGSVTADDMPSRPARPEHPKLVPPRMVPSPKQSPLPLNVYMLHNLAHIELNAIDLAWDTVSRFSELGLPEAFYADFAHVADDESRHLGWCLQRLGELGYAYGDMVAHDLLWEGAQMSAEDIGWRMCLVPMSQEARGLDAGPRLVQKMVGWGDNRTAAIVDRISLEEKAHVAVGVSWFGRICLALEHLPEEHFRSTMSRLCPELLNGYFNHEARSEVGLPQSWYDLAAWPCDEARSVAASVGLVIGKPGKRVDPSAPPLPPPDKISTPQLLVLQARLAAMMEIEIEMVDSRSR